MSILLFITFTFNFYTIHILVFNQIFCLILQVGGVVLKPSFYWSSKLAMVFDPNWQFIIYNNLNIESIWYTCTWFLLVLKAVKAGKAFTTALSSGLLPKESYQLKDSFSISINKTIMHTIDQAFEYQDINTNWNQILCNSVFQVMFILLI